MKRNVLIIISILLLSGIVFAEDANKRFQFSGYMTPGGQLTNDPPSSKFNEYRDIISGFYIPGLWVDGFDTETNIFAEFRATEIVRDDMWLRARTGKSGFWNAGFEWNQIPHLLSLKARTPYNYQGMGIYNVPTTVPGLTELLAPTNAQLLANDTQVAGYIAQYLHSTPLSNERQKGTVDVEITIPKIEDLSARMGYSVENRFGSKITYGPIGDRPPRTLNIQFPEAIDYRISEVNADVDYVKDSFLVNLKYLFSNFDNKIDNERWQNIFTNAPGTFDVWDRNVGTVGARPLFPDNLTQNGSVTIGVDLPLDSYLIATGAYIWAIQDVSLLPYSSNGTVDTVAAATDPTTGMAWNDTNKLPRKRPGAENNTRFYNVEYIINSIQRMDIKAFYRLYDLNNDTPTTKWRYVTQETTNTNGTVNYRNMRLNLAYDYAKMNAGAEARYHFDFWKSVWGLGYDREDIDREFREADTGENIFKTTLRSRPTDWLSFFAKYYFGDRDSGGYNGTASNISYWYTPAMVSGDRDNPEFTFYNHPDMRRYDVSARQRNVVDFYATALVLENVNIGASYHFLGEDFGSHVLPSQPLLNITGPSAAIAPADQTAFTPGDQVGLLDNSVHEFGFDVSYPFSDSITITLFFSQEFGKRLQRGFEFDENDKENPSAVATSNEFGPWTRATMQWLARIKNQTTTIGIGADYTVNDKLSLSTEHLFSDGEVLIVYSGYGTQASVNPNTTFPDTYQFAFRSPPTIQHLRYTGEFGFMYKIFKNMSAGLSYMFEYYKVKDWQQMPSTPWFEPVGDEHLLRDSSSATSTQWGNRLINLGAYLTAPSYTASVGTLVLTYIF